MNRNSGRRGARSRSEIPESLLAQLNSGRVAAATLAECLAVDHALLIRSVAPALAPESVAELQPGAQSGITRRMAAAADLLLAHLGESAIVTLSTHPSDTVRGWAAFMAGRCAGATPAERLALLRPLADDSHFGVREWTWLAFRPCVVNEPEHAIDLLIPWATDSSASIRRFASEATRPRGVWSAHVPALRRNPEIALPLLEPLRSDDSAYVQDSVANWLNDASKDQPQWVRSVCARWSAESASPATARICRRAQRSLKPA